MRPIKLHILKYVKQLQSSQQPNEATYRHAWHLLCSCIGRMYHDIIIGCRYYQFNMHDRLILLQRHYVTKAKLSKHTKAAISTVDGSDLVIACTTWHLSNSAHQAWVKYRTIVFNYNYKYLEKVQLQIQLQILITELYFNYKYKY